MSECILNLLPVTEEEQFEFINITPSSTHIFSTRSTVTPEQLASATIILGAPQPKHIHIAPNLRWFHTMWAGVDEYFSDGQFPKNISLSNSTGTNAQSVAEHMLTTLLSLCRKFPQAKDNQKNHLWKDVGNMKTPSNSTVLIIGAGNVGQKFGAFCQSMGAHTIGLRRSAGVPLHGLHELHTIAELDKFLPSADVVALCLPHAPETVNLIDSRRFSLMKQDAILINAGRGSVLDQDALIDSLERGQLWGAGIDVTDPEPLPASHRLWDTPNLLLTPHIAGGMRLEITRKNCIKLAQDNLHRYITGQPLINRVQ